MIESVENSADIQRIIALPRRVWTDEAGRQAAAELAVWLTAQLITAAGRAAGLALFPQQAIALWEIYQFHGFYGALPVGSGKTLISWLAAYMLGSRRPLLFTKANLRDHKTPKDFAEFRRYWATPSPPPQVEGYSLLSGDENLHVLEDRAPDLLFLDECQKLRKGDNTFSKRIGGYVDMTREACVVVATTGTPQRHSIKDDAHIVTWCLRERAPVAISSEALEQHGSALDSEKIVGRRLRPGALLSIADAMGIDQDMPELARAREGYSQRFEQTPGILLWPDSSCDQPLTVRFFQAPPDPIIEAEFIRYRLENGTPDGWPLIDAIVRWGYERMVSTGFYTVWDPRPPEAWANARYAAMCFIRDMVQATARYDRARSSSGPKPLDTERAVMRAFPDEPCIREWREIKDSFRPNPVPVWLSGSVVQWAASWAMQRNGAQAGIVWCEHVPLARAIAEVSGLPLYGEGGLRIDRNGRTIDNDVVDDYASKTPLSRRTSIICQADANSEGRNLQDFNDNLGVGWEPSGEVCEQRIGRTHRTGQNRPVNFDILVTCGLTMSAFADTLTEARQVQRMKKLTQKILNARIDYGAVLPLGARWAISRDE